MLYLRYCLLLKQEFSRDLNKENDNLYLNFFSLFRLKDY